jgi:hypothetical protein
MGVVGHIAAGLALGSLVHGRDWQGTALVGVSRDRQDVEATARTTGSARWLQAETVASPVSPGAPWDESYWGMGAGGEGTVEASV